jgi:enamine deaminase RidA (YjgF/YER057c/UK114 family)
MSLAPRPKVGNGANIEALAYDMFERAGLMLGECGFAFSDVIRTWVHVSDIDRNYAAMNRARNRYFAEQGLKWLPASTCVQGVPVGLGSPVALDLYAVSTSNDASPRLDVLHSGAMGEATAYGVAFSRAIRIRQSGLDRVFVSGTASIDAQGQVVSVGDARAQLDCMFNNVTSVLAEAQMDFTNIRSATAYLKSADSLADYVRAARAHGLAVNVPCAVVVTDICRPEWLCEIEVCAENGYYASTVVTGVQR